jgi:DNA-binding LytR/AlgR family response regulator
MIVEDEPPIADYIEKSARSLLGASLKSLSVFYSLEEAANYLENHSIDLCLLDLNLSGQDGFKILCRFASGSFHTIIVSAHTEQALRAFEYGVIDFVPKPFDPERLKNAFDRYFNRQAGRAHAKHLVYRKRNTDYFLRVKDVVFFRAVRYLVEAHTAGGEAVLLEKPLNRLEQILPDDFIRIHRSYIVNLDHVLSFRHQGGSSYGLRLRSGQELPISRQRYKHLAVRFKK